MVLEAYETSSAQKRLYWINDLLGSSILYNIPNVRVIEGPLDSRKLNEALRLLVQRHEGLRTSFVQKDGEVLQVVHENINASLQVSQQVTKGKDELIHEFIRPFDLGQAPLWRAKLIKTERDQHLFLFDIHHIIADAVTIHVLFHDLMALYQEEPLPPLEFQYVDYTMWQNDQLKGENIQKQKEYWLKEFADEVPLLDLPTDGIRSQTDYTGGISSLDIDSPLKDQLLELCSRYHVTLYMVLLTIYRILLSKHTGQNDLVIGTPVTGRSHPEFEGIVGMFVNTLALRHQLHDQKSFKQLLEEVADKTLTAFMNQDYPFDMLVEKSNPEREMGRNPLFDACFSLDHFQDPIMKSTNLTLYPYPIEHNISKFDLTLFAHEMEGNLRLQFEYRLSLFSADRIQRMLQHFTRIAKIVCDNPEIRIDDINIVSGEEQNTLLHSFNNTSRQYPNTETIHRLFEKQAMKTPDRPAVVFEDERLTYRQLNERANQLARYLREKGVKEEKVVGILAVPSLEMIVGTLAILKAGGAYVAIDPAYPLERIKYLLTDSEVRLCLLPKKSSNPHERKGEELEQLPVDILNLKNPDLYKGEKSNLPGSDDSKRLMYIIYTSGSTGKPKGVMVEHQALARLVLDPGAFTVREADCVLQTCSMAFDVAVFELWGTLLRGASLQLIHKEELLNARKLKSSMKQMGVTLAFFTAPLLHQLVDEDPNIFAGLRVLITGGESLSPRHINLLDEANPNLTVVNAYGPSESTIFTTFLTIDKQYEGQVPIGRPAPNTEVYILNHDEQLQPLGVPGELCIGGDGLARGYLARPELTKEKFVRNPFLKGDRMYRSGDRARWLSDGTIEFLGRMDNLVKIRGFRIEVGEIEIQLCKLKGVQEAVVMDYTHAGGEKYLCAYYTADEEVPHIKLRHGLGQQLPDYMIPAYFVRLSRIPLNTNGKVDRKALPEPNPAAAIETEHEAPCNDYELILLRIWSKILATEHLGVTDNFFTLGGSSLMATKMVSMVYKQMKKDIPLNKVFILPTIRQLAIYLMEIEVAEVSNRDEKLVLLKPGFNKERNVFFIHDGSGEISAYVDMVDQLVEDWNYWGIKVESTMLAEKTIEEVASNYITKIKTVQPTGSFYLVGWSLGGVIGFEMTKQLEDHQETVECLAILDSPPPQKNGKGIDFQKIINEMKNTDMEFNQWKQSLPKDIIQLIPNVDRLEKNELLLAVTRVNQWLQAQYAYQPTKGVLAPVHLFISEQSWKWFHKGWDPYCEGSIKTYQVPGDHFSIVRFPNLTDITSVMNELLMATKS